LARHPNRKNKLPVGFRPALPPNRQAVMKKMPFDRLGYRLEKDLLIPVIRRFRQLVPAPHMIRYLRLLGPQIVIQFGDQHIPDRKIISNAPQQQREDTRYYIDTIVFGKKPHSL